MDRLKYRGGIVGAGLPLLVFLAGALYLGLSGTPDERGFWPVAILSLIVGLSLAKNQDHFASTVIRGMSDEVVAVMILAWLLSGVIGEFVRASGAVESLVNLFVGFGVTPPVFVCGAFVVAAIVGTSTGTAVGTVLITAPVIFPIGLSIGAGPYWVLGAILGGGAFGDDFSPLSDTTIASAKTQGVEIDTSVRSRAKYAAVAAILALIGFYSAQHLAPAIGQGSAVDAGESELTPLIMLLGPALVVALCFARIHLLSALLWGVATLVPLGLATGLVPLERIFSLDRSNFTAQSIVIDGMARGVGISVFSILLIGLVRASLASGLIDDLLERTTLALEKRGRGKSAMELTIVSATIFVNGLLAHNTITIVALGDIVRRLGVRAGIGGIRRANLIDLAGNTVMHIFPYMITVILASSLTTDDAAAAGFRLSPWLVGVHNLHSWALLVIVYGTAATGFWRDRDENPGVS